MVDFGGDRASPKVSAGRKFLVAHGKCLYLK
jgi:hypothetical protein